MKNKLLLLILFLTSGILWTQNLKTEGKKLVDNSGEEVILRGMGLGGWMLMEGYMMQSSEVADTQHEFRERLIELMGESKTDEFFDAWLKNHVTKADIDSLSKWGFNSVRLPMHYNLFTLPIEKEPVSGENTWLDKGFNMVDDLLQWCEANQMYLILDLHAAPGGQGANAAISDYDPDKPSLWESEENRNKTVALWKKLAERYKDEPWIGGYDLLNEVNWNLTGNAMLRELYEEITRGIRTYDTNHIIFIEGNWFANDFTGLTPAWDDNMAYSFHKYWSFNDQASIQWVLDLREEFNVPLWMGEGGENSNVWFEEAISLFEENGIGWSWWPMKRIETIVGPYSIKKTQGYNDILRYWKGEIARPTEEVAFAAMMELAINARSENCNFQKDVPDAQIRQVSSDETKPYAYIEFPGILHMSDYDMGKNKIAYYDIDAANYQLSTNQFQAWNSGWVYRNDGVDIESNTDDINSNGFHLGFIRKSEWINYTINISESGKYRLDTRVAAIEDGGRFHLALNNESITPVQETMNTGGWDQFTTQQIHDVALEAGVHQLTFHADGDISFNISSIEFIRIGSAEDIDFYALSGDVSNDETSIEIIVNQPILAETLNGTTQDFTLWVNGIAKAVTEVGLKKDKERTIILNTADLITNNDEVKVSYDGTSITNKTGVILNTFSNLEIFNNLPERFLIPGLIEVERFYQMSGLQTEETTDTGGGENIGYTDPGDYADYLINVSETGNFDLKVRIASESQAGKIGIYLLQEDQTETSLLNLDLPVTGGWQIWESITGTINLSEGSHVLRMRVLEGGFNMNWIEIAFPDSDNDGVTDDIDDCPNTEMGVEVNEKGCEIPNLPANNFTIKVESETCNNSNNGRISISALATYNYTANLSGPDQATNLFTETTVFDELEAGSYQICLFPQDDPLQEVCYTIIVHQPSDLQVSTAVNAEAQTISLALSGSKNYYIKLNDQEYFTSDSNIVLPLQASKNNLNVKTDLDCQGEYQEIISISKSPLIYPNPISGGLLFVNLGYEESVDASVSLYDMTGKLIYSENKKNVKGSLSIDASSWPNGIYIMKVLKDDNLFNYKIIK